MVVAGDINVHARGVEWANEAFSCPVIYVCGNHEFYRGHIDYTLTKIRRSADQHVQVLENESLIIDGVRLLGGTGWTDFTATDNAYFAASAAAEQMNDYRLIRAGSNFRRLRPADVIGRNIATRVFLERELAAGFEGKTVVITHHCPVPEAAGDLDEGDLGAAYYNRWHSLVSQADAWIFGHAHTSVDFKLGDCRLVSNPRGYPGEPVHFDHLKMIET